MSTTKTSYDATSIASEAIARGEDPLASVVFQALGAASVCWDDMSGTGVFQSDRAKAIGDSLVAYLNSRH